LRVHCCCCAYNERDRSHLQDFSEEFLGIYPFGRKDRKYQGYITTVTKNTGDEKGRWVGSYPKAGFGVRGVGLLCSANKVR